MVILSINFNHDGSAAIIAHGKVAAYINTERFSKKKKHPGIRTEDLNNLLRQAAIKLNDVSIVLLCNIHNMDSPDIPFLHGSNLKETWFNFWVNQTLDKITIDGIEFPCVINPNHHLLHNALAYYTSPFKEAICFSWDPIGYSVCIGTENKLDPVNYNIKDYNSCTWYSRVATSLFDTGIVGAGKVMGLAPFGAVKSISEELNKINSLRQLFDCSSNDPVYIDSRGKKVNARLAFNAQRIMEIQLTSILKDLCALVSSRGLDLNVCLGGGGALNSVANQVAFANSGFKNLYIHPASGDDGTAIGAGLWYWYCKQTMPRQHFTNREIMYSIVTYDDTIEYVLESSQYQGLFAVDRSSDYIFKAAKYLTEGKTVAWFQDASEIGPRALGNRSILADPTRPEMKDYLNKRVKSREVFRPFAPSVLNEYAEEWFGLKDSPFMLRVSNVLRSGIPSVTHVDQTARIQTVTEEDNPNFYKLIKTFFELTGVPMVLNTSFNINGQPIVESAEDAINSFLSSEIDVLVFKNILIQKSSVVSKTRDDLKSGESGLIEIVNLEIS